MSEPQRVQVRRKSTGQTGTWIPGKPDTFVPDQNVFQKANAVLGERNLKSLPVKAARFAVKGIPDEALSAVGGGIGGVGGALSRIPGGGYLGATAGSTLGEMERQFRASERGKPEQHSGTNLALAAAGGLAGEGIGNAAFRVGRGAAYRFFPGMGEKLAAGAKAAVGKRVKDLGVVFEQNLGHLKKVKPDATFDLSPEMNELAYNAFSNPTLRSTIEAGANKANTKVLVDLMDNPSAASNLTLDQTQQVIKTLDSIPRMRMLYKAGSPQYQGADKPLFHLRGAVRAKQFSAVPEFESVVKNYHKGMKGVRAVEPAVNRADVSSPGGAPNLPQGPTSKIAAKEIFSKTQRRQFADVQRLDWVTNPIGTFIRKATTRR